MTEMPESIVILGATFGARETFWFVRDVHPEMEFVFVDDLTDTTEVNAGGRTWPVVKDWDFTQVRQSGKGKKPLAFDHFLIGLGHPPDKKVMVDKALAHGLKPAPTLISPQCIVRPCCTIGRGGLIQPFTIFTAGATLGDYVFLASTSVGDAATFGDFSTCYVGCHVSSEVSLGEGVLLGAGTVVKQEVSIAPWVTVGAQSCVVKDITEAWVTVAGVPARRLDKSGA